MGSGPKLYKFTKIILSLQDMYCTYKMYLDEKETRTKTVSETSNPDFNHSKKFAFKVATEQVIIIFLTLRENSKYFLFIRSLSQKKKKYQLSYSGCDSCLIDFYIWLRAL